MPVAAFIMTRAGLYIIVFLINVYGEFTDYESSTQEQDCGMNWMFIHRACYRFSAEALSWDDAFLSCQSEGGYLLSISDVSEKNKMRAEIRKLDPKASWWIGLKHKGGNVWEWLDKGSPFSTRITPWESRQPFKGGMQDCVDFSASGKISDDSCATTKAFICERHEITPRPVDRTTTPSWMSTRTSTPAPTTVIGPTHQDVESSSTMIDTTTPSWMTTWTSPPAPATMIGPTHQDPALTVSQVLEKIEDTLSKPEIGSNQTVADDVVQSLSQIIENSVTALKDNTTGDRILAAIHATGREANLTEGNFLSVASNLAVSASSINPSTLYGLVITAHAGDDNHFQEGEIQKFYTTADVSFSRNVSSLILPASLISSSNGSRVVMAVHISSKVFEAILQRERDPTSSETQSDGKITQINSYVMAASVEDSVIILKDLKDPVRIRLVHIQKWADNPICVFWDTSLGEGRGGWSTAGCWRVPSFSTSTSTLCECNHLTNFALLMDVYQTGDLVPEVHHHVLSIISYTGCGVSVGALILTVLTYCIWNPTSSTKHSRTAHRRGVQFNVPTKILLCLCTALGLSNLTFVGGMQPFTMQQYWPCKIVAMLLHAFMLSSLCWMAVEAFYMYLSLVRVFRTHVTRFMLTCSSVAWGVPVVIVAVTAAVDLDTYLQLSSGMCWLSGTAFYASFVAPVGVIMVFNGVTFTMVLRRILTLSDNRMDKSRSTRAATQLRRATGVLVLLGLTWVFGFLAVDRASLVFQYLFSIFNSLQGTFIFTFYCVMNQEVRLAWRRSFCKCCLSRGESGEAAPEPRLLAAEAQKRDDIGATLPTVSGDCSAAVTSNQILTSGADGSGIAFATLSLSATKSPGDK